jgi:hypothetical protein
MEFTYKLLQNQPNFILRIEDGAVIPKGANGDWQLYEAWLAEGNTPILPDELPKPIREIDATTLRLSLLKLNLLDDVEDALSTLPRAAQIAWEYSIVIKEDSVLVQEMISKLKLDVDLIFKTALELE